MVDSTILETGHWAMTVLKAHPDKKDRLAKVRTRNPPQDNLNLSVKKVMKETMEMRVILMVRKSRKKKLRDT